MPTYRSMLVPGGTWFVASNPSSQMKWRYTEANVLTADNVWLWRLGSETNLQLREHQEIEPVPCGITNSGKLRLDSLASGLRSIL